MPHLRRYGLVALAWGLLQTSGCGSGDEIQLTDVAGNVTFAGQPVVYGNIEFAPDTGKQHSGPAGTAEIVNGQYDTAQAGRGVVPGSHLVRITAYEDRPAPGPDDETLPSDAKPPLFSGYTIEADVSGPAHDFEVPESARGFDIFKSQQSVQPGNAP